jgi:glycogen operon protein
MTGELATRMVGGVLPRAAAAILLNQLRRRARGHAGRPRRLERKHNEANGEENRDGTEVNFSWNYGGRRPVSDPRSTCVPPGDVRGLPGRFSFARDTDARDGRRNGPLERQQQCVGTGRCQTWLDWSTMDAELAAFVATLMPCAMLIPLRHDLISRRADHASGMPDKWRHPDGSAMTDWIGNIRQGRHRAALYTEASGGTAADHVAVALNSV